MPEQKFFLMYPNGSVYGKVTIFTHIKETFKVMFNSRGPKNEFAPSPGITAYYFAGADFNPRATATLKPVLDVEFPDRAEDREIRGIVAFAITGPCEVANKWFADLVESEKPRNPKRPVAAKTAEALFVADQLKKNPKVKGPNVSNKYKNDYQKLPAKEKQKWEALHRQQHEVYLTKLSELKTNTAPKPQKAKRAHNLYDTAMRKENPTKYDAKPWRELTEEEKKPWKDKERELDAQRTSELKAKVKVMCDPPSDSPKRDREDRNLDMAFEDVVPPTKRAKKLVKKPNIMEDSSDSNSESEEASDAEANQASDAEATQAD